jgi:hypothetical protein
VQSARASGTILVLFSGPRGGASGFEVRLQQSFGKIKATRGTNNVCVKSSIEAWHLPWGSLGAASLPVFLATGVAAGTH